MAEKKLTKKAKIRMLLDIKEVQENPTLVEYLENEYDLLERKSSNKAPSKNQVANESLKEVIVDILTTNATEMSIREIQADNEVLAELSNQKMSALLTQLVDTGIVERIVDKKKTYFKVK
jgi:predicted transcriptional regulator